MTSKLVTSKDWQLRADQAAIAQERQKGIHRRKAKKKKIIRSTEVCRVEWDAGGSVSASRCFIGSEQRQFSGASALWDACFIARKPTDIRIMCSIDVDARVRHPFDAIRRLRISSDESRERKKRRHSLLLERTLTRIRGVRFRVETRTRGNCLGFVGRKIKVE